MLTIGGTMNVREQSKKRMKREQNKKIIKTRTNLNIYQQKRTNINRICRRKKKEWIEVKIKGINEINRKRDTRKFYKDVRNLSNLPTVTTLVCKDKDGSILSEKKKRNIGKMATVL